MHSVTLGQPQYSYDFFNLSLILCLQYAEVDLEICQSGDMPKLCLNFNEPQPKGVV